MNNKSKDFLGSFDNAFKGFYSAFLSEKNLRFHFIAAITAVCMGLFCKITVYEWISLIIVIAIVIISELFNTAIELSVDYFSPEENPAAKTIKDISASAVLIAAISSIALGIIIFGSKLLVILGVD